MNLKTLFVFLNILNLLAILLVILVILEYQSSSNKMEQAYISKNRSFLLADELRQSSDDLTRLVRTYSITSNPRFKAQYYEILAIRNGLYPRPAHYNRIYWDFLSVDGTSNINSPQKKAISLRELMIQAGFTKQELALLNKSQDQSDALVRLEEQSMQAIEGLFKDEEGFYNIIGKPDAKLARELLHSDEYHRSKVKIMRPLDEFFKLLEERTDSSIKEAQDYVKTVRDTLVLVVFFFVLLMATSIGIMLHRIIYPLIALKKSMLRLADNDISSTIPVHHYKDEIGGMIQAIKIFKENTKKLVVSEQKVKLLFDSVGEGFFGLDARGAFTFVNPVACEILGYTSEELLGTYLYKSIDTQKFSTRMSKLLLNDESIKTTGVIHLQHKDNTLFPAEYTSTPILDKNDNIEGSVIVFSDITQRQKHEKALNLAKESAEAANRSKTLFLANMSHELRTPLNAILGFSKLLVKDKKLPLKHKENLETIHKSGKHLLSIISEILEVAKLQAGKIEIKENAFDLHAFLNNIIHIFENRAQDKGLEFKYDDYAHLPRFIISDEQRLRQIFFNILGNAIKFTDKGCVCLYLSYANEHLECRVVDTGPGIKESDISTIFKPFEQIKSTHDYNEGTGLGLAITKELLSLMQGELNVKSAVDKGTEFIISLPCTSTFMGEVATLPMEQNLVLQTDSKTYTVLVVDDIAENRSLLVQTLQYLGINTCEANNGAAALEQLEVNPCDMVFMDIQMPVMDGFEAIDKIRSGTVCPNIPVALVSANVFDEDRQRALEEGANTFIEKPIQEKDLIAALQTFLGLSFIQEEFSSHLQCPQTSSLTKEQLHKLEHAAKELNTGLMESLLDEYAQKDTELVHYLCKQVHDYNFKAILSLCTSLLEQVND